MYRLHNSLINNLKFLISILSDGQFHSGSELGKTLSLTRSAIWKLIKKLDQYEIEIEAKTNLGYRIPQGLELLNKNIIKKYLSLKYRHYLEALVIFDELPSTNLYLAELKDSKTKICLAECQTAGKGRLGRQWVSPYAKNISLSIRWDFSKDPAQLSGLSLAVAIAVLETLKIYGIKHDLWLKWPNDVLWENQKLSGILIELSGEIYHLYRAIIGIGINVNMSPKQGQKIDQPWCNIAQLTDSIPQRNKLIGILLDQLFTTVEIYQEQGFQPFIERWTKADICYNKPVKIITPTKVISGTSRGINEQGHFLLEDTKGNINTFVSGEVSLKI